MLALMQMNGSAWVLITSVVHLMSLRASCFSNRELINKGRAHVQRCAVVDGAVRRDDTVIPCQSLSSPLSAPNPTPSYRLLFCPSLGKTIGMPNGDWHPCGIFKWINLSQIICHSHCLPAFYSGMPAPFLHQRWNTFTNTHAPTVNCNLPSVGAVSLHLFAPLPEVHYLDEGVSDRLLLSLKALPGGWSGCQQVPAGVALPALDQSCLRV